MTEACGCTRSLRCWRKLCRPASTSVATPIGNLADITLRALADAGARRRRSTARTRATAARCWRTSRITRPLRAYHEHNAERERPRIMAELTEGRSVALISDAGTPLISDPGYKLVRAALARRPPRRPACPARSALLAVAHLLPGLPPMPSCSSAFCRPSRLPGSTRLAEFAATPATLVAFEAPARPPRQPRRHWRGASRSRPRGGAAELTKLHEEVRSGGAAELAQWATLSAPREGKW